MPTAITAGTTTIIRLSYSDYPASTNTLKLYLSGVSVANVTAVADGDEYLVTITAVVSGGLTAGNYRWTARVTTALSEVVDVASGVLLVVADPATATAGSFQTHAERTLALIDLAIEGRVPENMQSYQIGGRAIVKWPPRDLLRYKGIYQSIVNRERNPGQFGTPIYVEFGGG